MSSPVLYYIFPIKEPVSGETIAYATVTRNIAERKKMEQSLREAISIRDEFLLIASHELRTPITSLKLQLQLAKRKVKPELNQSLSPEKFVQVIDSSSSSRSISGLGLGLFIVTQIVRGHGGTVQVDSQEGKGTRFVVELPLRPQEACDAHRGPGLPPGEGG